MADHPEPPAGACSPPVPAGPHWPVPVLVGALAQRRNLVVTIQDQEVILIPPTGARHYIVPATSDAVLCQALQEARDIQRQMGQGL